MDDKPRIAVDVDKTVLAEAEFPELGEPLDGAREGLRDLQRLGFEVILYSCRTNGYARDTGVLADNVRRLEEHFQKHGLPYDAIVMPEEGKPFAAFYVDDRGVRFDGDWPAVVRFVSENMDEAVEQHWNDKKAFALVAMVERLARAARRANHD